MMFTFIIIALAVIVITSHTPNEWKDIIKKIKE